jgi:propanediol dehydratase small subunit
MNDQQTGQARHYPLAEHEAETLRSASGRTFNEIAVQGTLDGTLTPDDLRIHADTLRAQAQIAREAGHPQLAGNLLRAAELTAVPNEELLKMYDLLRPGRASYDTLMKLAQLLESTYAAAETASFVREAAEVYKARGLLRRET